MVRNEFLQILRHSLGLRDDGRGKEYRNHFYAGGGDVLLCRELVELGLMSERTGVSPELTGGCPVFYVTPKGKGEAKHG